MSENAKTRRAVLGVLAGAGALATVPIVASAATVDPVFAAIEAHRAAWVAVMVAQDRVDNWRLGKPQGRTVAPVADVRAVDDADAAERVAMATLLDTPPATMAGLRAVIAYFIKWDDNIPPDTSDYLRTILRSRLLAEVGAKA